ncbi:hypothetical protein AOLI_G00133100 [Acnodon oligacanthus]
MGHKALRHPAAPSHRHLCMHPANIVPLPFIGAIQIFGPQQLDKAPQHNPPPHPHTKENASPSCVYVLLSESSHTQASPSGAALWCFGLVGATRAW